MKNPKAALFDWAEVDKPKAREQDVLDKLKGKTGLALAAAAALTVFLVKVPPHELEELVKKAVRKVAE